MRAEHQLKTFLRLLKEYPQDTPLTRFLPGFFKQNKQMGSTDRRVASRLIYNYFRLGKACTHLPADQRLFVAEYLCYSGANPFLQHFRPDLYDTGDLSLTEKIGMLTEEGFALDEVFPFTAHLSEEIDKGAFLSSFFIQPDLFIRMHPGKDNVVQSKLADTAIAYRKIDHDTLSLPNGTRLHEILPEASYQVQDLSSQRTISYFRPQPGDYWWDACAASGGKSLLLFHQQPDIKLLVSDVRESILNNLDTRFHQAGLHRFQKKVLDLTKNTDPDLHHYEFDGIILDAPCSGSGTWGRTPEMISQFQERKIPQFQYLQRTIASNVVKYLKPGKPLIYITCSVFKEENEDVVRYLVSELGLNLEEQKILSGYTEKADTMFIARLTR
ncbi:MAG TPA: RsmB/NOP family class I SAM-dependent RNA methyltransferase [Sphingobacteriaceae bacterium]